MKRFRNYYNNLHIKTKMILSYAVIGILPFVVFSFGVLHLFNQQMTNTVRHGYETTFYNTSAAIRNKLETIEYSMNTIASNSNVAETINAVYENSFSKYYDIKYGFDPVVDTFVILNPELSGINFYVSDTYAGIRTNFISLKKLEAMGMLDRLQNTSDVQWFYKEQEFYAYAKIYCPSNIGIYSIMEICIPEDELLDLAAFEDFTYQITIRGEEILRKGEPVTAEPLYQNEIALTEDMSLAVWVEKKEGAYIASGGMAVIVVGILAAFLILVLTIIRFSDGFTRRIHVMNAVLADTVKNRFSVRLPVSYQDEIGELTNVINKILEETKQLIEDVYESQLREREYEMKALQAQINPHFLYNTLSAINWYAIKTDNSTISEIVTSLSNFYRTALNQGDNVTTVGNELENIKAYVKIQENIFSFSFDVIYDIDESLLQYRMPNLIIQPIVENAIEHGIHQKLDGRGLLTIRLFRSDNWLQFEIIDNGGQMEYEEMEELLRKDTKNYGIKNVDKRLQLFYKGNYRFTFQKGENTVFILKILLMEE